MVRAARKPLSLSTVLAARKVATFSGTISSIQRYLCYRSNHSRSTLQRLRRRPYHRFTQSGDPENARKLFDEMPQEKTASLVAYSTAGRVEEALCTFQRASEKNVVSWTVLISEYARNGREVEAFELFRRMVMVREGRRTVPNHFTLVSMLNACAKLPAISLGKQLHSYITRRSGGGEFVFVGNALVDMYAKCGDVCSAVAAFEAMREKDVVTWNSMLGGYAQHGMATQAVRTLERMRVERVVPNHVTFLSLLSACNHAGLVDGGRRYLRLMEEEYGLRPRREHYAVMVDLLGRSGRLAEAVGLVEKMPGGRGDLRCWGSLLAACRLQGDVELGRKVAELLFELEPGNVGRYVMLSNVYAAAGEWRRSIATRRLSMEQGSRKEVACSWIEVSNVKHTFVAGDRSHPRESEIYLMLRWAFLL